MKKTLVLFSLAAILGLFSCSKDGGSAKPDLNNVKPLSTATGDVAGSVKNTVIGAAGGTAASADGKLTITVPAGALAANTNVGIQPISNNAPLGLGQGYRLTPEGTVFTKPVTLTFRYDDTQLNGAIADFLWLTTQNADGTWSALTKSEVNTSAKTVTATTTHFSDWAIGRFIDLAIKPASATVMINKSINLEVTGFLREKDDAEIVPLSPVSGEVAALATEAGLLAATEKYLSFDVKGWSLNAVNAPVSNANGKLEGKGHTAKYTAPSKRPNPSTVAVTAQLLTTYRRGGSADFKLTTNITIVESEYYLFVKIDDQQYVYAQWGLNGSVPPDPNDLELVNCGRGIYGQTAISAGHYAGSSMTNMFTLSIDDVSKGMRQLRCINSEADNNEEVTFTPTTRGYTNSYTIRTKKNGACQYEYACSYFLYDILQSPGNDGVIEGAFLGTLWEDPPGAEDACQMPIEHRVTGSFRLKRVN